MRKSKQYEWLNPQLQIKSSQVNKWATFVILVVLALTVWRGFTWYGLIFLLGYIGLQGYRYWLKRKDMQLKLRR